MLAGDKEKAMGPLAKSVITTIMAIPVLIVLLMFLPDSLEWWQSVSVGIVSAMLAGHWLRHIERA
jgi:hypothetical protein